MKLEEENSRLKKRIEKLELDLDNYSNIGETNKQALDNFKKNLFEEKHKKIANQEPTFKELFEYAIDKINSMLMCPMLCTKMENPAILESGQTIDEGFLVKLIQKKKPDPFDREKTCK